MTFSTAKGLSYRWCLSPDTGLPRPDLVLFLNISKEAASQRGGYGEERYEKQEMQEKVRNVFLDMYRRREGKCEEWAVVDAGKSVDEVEEECWRKVKEAVGKVWRGELGDVGLTAAEVSLHA